jgi:hypothetical protein
MFCAQLAGVFFATALPSCGGRKRYELLFESFAGMLVVAYGVSLPGFDFMDEDDEEAERLIEAGIPVRPGLPS